MGTNFPSFLEGLSLRRDCACHPGNPPALSLPFRKGFHRGDGYVANNGYVWFIFLPIRRGFL